jgi:hypothetical protein
MELDIPFLHNDDIIEVARESEVTFYIIDREQAKNRELAFIKKLILINKGDKTED